MKKQLMKLEVSSKELQQLIDEKVVRPLDDEIYQLIVVTPKTGELLPINIHIHLTEEEKQKMPPTTITRNDIEKGYTEFRKLFPRSDRHNHFYKTRNLMSGTSTTTLTRYKKLVIEEGFTPSELLDAMKHEVIWRVQVSLRTGKNKLTYMKGFEAWLNNTENIKTQLEEMKDQGSPGVPQDILKNIDIADGESFDGRTTRTL